jgi:hypothetical protein
MVDRRRFSLLAVIAVAAVSLPAPTAEPVEVMTPLPPGVRFAAMEQGVPDAACVAQCAAVRDRGIAEADRLQTSNEYFSKFNSNCWALPGAPNCAVVRQACWDACAPKYDNACMSACNPPFQSCCAANAKDIERNHYEACVVKCPKGKEPAAPPVPASPVTPPVLGGAVGGGGVPVRSTAEAVMARAFEVWMQVPKYSDVINLITTQSGPLADAFIIGPDGAVHSNRGVTRRMPEFLEDRVQAGPPFAVLDDVVFMQVALAQLTPGLTEAELNILTGQLAMLGALAPGIKDRSYTAYQAGATCGAPERLEQVRKIQLSDSLSSTCVFTPNSSVRETLETAPSDNQWVGSSEHASVRGTINGSGDFIDLPPAPPPDIRTPFVVVLASSRRGSTQATRPITQLVLPGLVVTGLGGNAEVVADLGANGLESLVCLKGVARVEEHSSGTVRTVRAGEAVVVLPGIGVSTPQPLPEARLRPLIRPTMIGSRVLKPGGEVRATPRLGGLLMVEARMVASRPAGAAYALEIGVGGTPLVSPLLNKSAAARLADGRSFEYRDPLWGRWLVFSSPDFGANNGPAGGVYQVTSDPGQAYRYLWDVPRASPGERVDLRLRNAHETLPMAVRVYR